MCEDNDPDTIAEVVGLGAEFPCYVVLSKHRNPTQAVNLGFKACSQELFMLATDDLEFTPGWLDPILRRFEDPQIQVCAPWDGLFERGKSSYVMRRRYIEECGTIDELGKVFHEGYAHCYVDKEFLDTAIHRGVFAFIKESLVKHCHANSPFAKYPQDATYHRLNELSGTGSEDQALYESRKHLFRGSDRTDIPFD